MARLGGEAAAIYAELSAVTSQIAALEDVAGVAPADGEGEPG